MSLSHSSEEEDAEDKDIAQQPPHADPAPTRASMPQETGGAGVESATSTIASTTPLKWDPEQVTAQQEGGEEEREGCEAETHLWATVEEKQGSESAEEKDGQQQEEEEEGGVAGG